MGLGCYFKTKFSFKNFNYTFSIYFAIRSIASSANYIIKSEKNKKHVQHNGSKYYIYIHTAQEYIFTISLQC